jgi:hypothetical protein
MSDAPNPKMPPGPRNFGQFVAEHEDGRFHKASSDALHEVLLAVREAAGIRNGAAKAEMTIKLTVELDEDTVEITADITKKLPKLKRGKSIYWITPEGHLARSNPNQRELDLRDVTSGAGASTARNLA